MTACQRIGKRGAGADRLAVNEHGTCAAGALRAAVLHACQMQRIAQIAQQPLVFLYRDFCSVYKKYGHGKKLPSFESRLSRHSRGCSRHRATVIPKFPGHGTKFLKIFYHYTIIFCMLQETGQSIVILFINNAPLLPAALKACRYDIRPSPAPATETALRSARGFPALCASRGRSPR